MFNIGGAELLVILLVALLVLGPNKLPQAARQVGHFLGEFRRIADGFQNELKSAMDDPLAMAPKKPPAEKPKSPGGPTVIEADSTDADEPATDGNADDGAEVTDPGPTANGTAGVADPSAPDISAADTGAAATDDEA
ncbi:MAG: twin-arginine translocase subunit TatB [Acidimicrobiales bacterium]|nr:twin-arginine translocase subunit TatB [Acidimicrobiales bacterium]